MAGHVHVVGGGLAGLSAAVELAGGGTGLTVYEAGPACGGRARSYYDRQLGCRIDNGNHLLLSANDAVFRYLGLIGAERSLTGPARPIFPFVDLGDGTRWTLDLSRGRLPLWLLSPHRRVPGMRLGEIRSLTRLMRADAAQTVADCLVPGMLATRLLAPFAVSALNTPCETGSAALLGAVIRESLAKGGGACLPRFPAVGLSESFVDPALDHLALLKAQVRTGCRVSGVTVDGDRIAALRLPEGEVVLGPRDAVILAVTAPVAADLLGGVLPGLTVPDAFESIVNVHFRLDPPPVARGALGRAQFIGVVGGITEWVFVKGDILSVTVSAANRYADRDNDDLAAAIWAEVRAAVDPALLRPLPADMPPMRLVRERRATFAATPAQNRLRPPARTALDNLFLAGDWTATGLPATIEGAIRSGVTAARAWRDRDLARR